jgi:membrane protease YdiL (CAAX protease family)
MAMDIIRIAICILFTIWIHQGKYSPPLAPSRKPSREFTEVAVLVGGLLIVPFFKFDLLWYSGWLSPYLLFGLIVPFVMEFLVCKRKLSLIGFRWPSNRRVLAIVAGLFALYLTSRLVEPIVTGERYHLELRGLLSNGILFPFLEEILFRGLIQTRLESALGAVRSWIATGIFFGFYHCYVNYLIAGRALTFEDVLELVYLAAFGMLLGVIFSKTRSLLPSFIIHAVNNFSL